MNSWRRKTAIQVKNIPSNADEEEIMLRFEGRSYWGRELDVKQVVPVESSDVTYVIFNDEQGGFGSSKAFVLFKRSSYYYLFRKSLCLYHSRFKYFCECSLLDTIYIWDILPEIHYQRITLISSGNFEVEGLL